jgi:glycosyltransferase involved in cell wall biosynthesis
MFMYQLSPLVFHALRGVPTVLHLVNYDLVCPLNTKVLPDGTRCTHRAGMVCHDVGCIQLAGVARFAAQRTVWARGLDAVDLVVANSAWVAGRLSREGIGVDAVVWNGTRERPARPALTGPPTVSFAGRLYPKKGVEVLLRSMTRVPDARLVVAGEGPVRPALEQLATELGLGSRVRFLGHVPHEALERELAGAWAHAVPSVWEEPFGLTASEALMRGTAVVASSQGGVTEFVHDGQTGILVEPADEEALAAALRRLLDHRELAEKLGAEGRRFALAELTEERFLDRVEALYERVLERRRRVETAIAV